MVLTPDATVFFPMEQLLKSTGGKTPEKDERVILIVAREDPAETKPSVDGFYPIGVAGVVTEVNANEFAAVRTQYRVDIQDVWVQGDGTLQLGITRRNEIEDLDPKEEQTRLNNLLDEMRTFSQGFRWAEAAKYYIDQIDSIGMAACAMSPWLELSNEERYAILAEDSKRARAEVIERVLYGFLEVGRITNEAVTSQQEEHHRMYREAAIKRQIERLQKELDEMHPENVTDIRRFETKIAESGMNDTARKEAEKVLHRLKQEGKESVESGMLYDYLDFITSLSWKKEKAAPIDLKAARQILDEDHYGLEKVKDRIIQQIAVMNLKQKQSGSILLLVGAPGTGKTSVGKSIARALGREYVRVALGGVHDESDIRGHRRTYIGAMPGRIMDGIQKSGVSNPVMVLDEVDKLSASYNGSPASALLEVLDPEQNNTFTDHYLNVPYDLSDVLFLCTANSTDTIPEPLLNRMEVIQFNGYTPIEKRFIAERHLVPKATESVGIPKGKLTFTEDALKTLISDYTMEAGVRGLRKHIDTLCRIMAVKLAENPDETLTVTPEVVKKELDMRPIEHASILPAPKAGVVTGLAWTPVGGEILYIETMFTKGRGELLLTGQLGDVMKESARIAISLVKSLYPDQAELFEKNDLHIHVPDGATPKDGPSAGITLTTAIASLVTDKAVSPAIGMTGEVSLRGGVNPIGGLPEKLMAAHRSGVKQVFIPKDNEEDLRDVADEIKSALKITPVSEVSEVLRALGIKPRTGARKKTLKTA
jgi:ATP-dependent Lon protease